MPRVIVWFSCGAPSACAAKLALTLYNDVEIVYCDTIKTEHPDNGRFLLDVQKWLGKKITTIGSTKYEVVDDVFEDTRYMSGIHGARCTTEMKKIPRFKFQRPGDVHVFGLAEDEPRRIALFEANNRDLQLKWVLRDHGMKLADCRKMVQDAGIALPAMYSLGFRNNNCLGCVKATSAVYWDKTRTHFPEVFSRRAVQSRELGVRLVRYHGKRIFLDELPVVITDRRKEEDIECGPVCVSKR